MKTFATNGKAHALSLNTTESLKETKIKSINYLKQSTIKGGGWGVFAGKDYNKGDLIEQNVLLECGIKSVPKELKSYMFNHPNSSINHILPIGSNALFNHSKDKHNINPYNFDLKSRIQSCYAIKDIKKMMNCLLIMVHITIIMDLVKTILFVSY